MSRTVTEEMISALIDGELTPEDRAWVEKEISTHESLRQLYEGFKGTSEAIRESSQHVQSTVKLPSDFTSRVMADVQIQAAASTEPTVETSSTERNSKSNVAKRGSIWSTRTWIELVAATAAIVLIVVVWQSRTVDPNTVAKPDEGSKGSDVEKQRPKNGVYALGNKDGEFEKNSPNVVEPGSENSKDGTPATVVRSSREFSVFVKADTRPVIDRFWILNDYKVTAPEGVGPEGTGAPVNVLLIDAKKEDVLKFFDQLNDIDSGFQVFQQAKSGAASWLAPFDISKAGSAEGDFWTLQIVLIK